MTPTTKNLPHDCKVEAPEEQGAAEEGEGEVEEAPEKEDEPGIKAALSPSLLRRLKRTSQGTFNRWVIANSMF